MDNFLTYLPPAFLYLNLLSLHLGPPRSNITLMILTPLEALIPIRYSVCFLNILQLFLPLRWQSKAVFKMHLDSPARAHMLVQLFILKVSYCILSSYYGVLLTCIFCKHWQLLLALLIAVHFEYIYMKRFLLLTYRVLLFFFPAIAGFVFIWASFGFVVGFFSGPL